MDHFLAMMLSALTVFMGADNPAEGRTLRIATPIVVPRIANPYAGLSLPSTIGIIPVFDPLVAIDAAGRVRPWLAESWTSQDARVWTINLRPGVVFSNGAPLAAEALASSATYLKTPKGSTLTAGSTLANIARAVVTGPLTVEIHLAEPDPLFPQRMAVWKIPEPRTWIASLNADGDGRGIGSGPFMIVREEKADIVMVANPHAWNPPAADGLEIRLLPEQTTRMQALAADAIDIALQIGPGDREDLSALGSTALSRLTYRVNYVSFATAHVPKSPINDARVRLALNHAVNRQAIADVLLGGIVTPIGQLIMPGAPGYVAEIGPYPYDPARAKALLAEAGFGKGLKLSVSVAPGGADEASVYQQIAQDLAAVGVTLTVVPTAMTEMTRMMFAGDFRTEMFANFGRGLDGLGDYRYRSCLGQTGIYKPYFCDPVSLDFVKQAQAATNESDVDRLMQQVTRREYENPPGIFLWQNSFLDGAGPRVDAVSGYADYYDFIPFHALRLKN
jgi:peptide/nickel transport system substrate-binding protein